jgi:hypothetical protein
LEEINIGLPVVKTFHGNVFGSQAVSQARNMLEARSDGMLKGKISIVET